MQSDKNYKLHDFKVGDLFLFSEYKFWGKTKI